jgi:23S rRNA (cytidine1920-2'-O)/16S rRNA (cytidine1409-2'-O)-methyltransferase
MKPVAKRRIDLLLVEKGIVESREKAKALVMAGEVIADERKVTKPGTLVRREAIIRVRERLPFVSRGGIKLAHALDKFQLEVTGKVVADIGASTGGFTDCLLQRGAKQVYAIDVGYGQLDYRLRTDPRVIVMEGINARYPFFLPQKVDLATLDLSFISVEKVIPSVARWLKEGGFLIVLLKPQFEVGREHVGKGGLVKDPLLHARVLGRFISWAIENGFRLRGIIPSPLLGAAGNREFFVLLRAG